MEENGKAGQGLSQLVGGQAGIQHETGACMGRAAGLQGQLVRIAAAMGLSLGWSHGPPGPWKVPWVAASRTGGWSLPGMISIAGMSLERRVSGGLRLVGMTSLLEKPVLVLNRYWQPVHTCSVRRSVRLLCTGHAQVVQVDGDEQYRTHDLVSWIGYSLEAGKGERVHSARISLLVPSVVVLAFYNRVPRMEVRFSRRNVFLRDRFTCQYCDRQLPESQLNLDHVVPRDKGGVTSWENIVTSCFRCNTRKGNRLPAEADMVLRVCPEAPRWKPLFGMMEAGLGEESWVRFLGPMAAVGRLSA